FQAEDGIRDFHVTGVQTCALPIYPADWNQFDEIMKDEQGPAMIKAMKAYAEQFIDAAAQYGDLLFEQNQTRIRGKDKASKYAQRSEERRVGKGLRFRRDTTIWQKR